MVDQIPPLPPVQPGPEPPREAGPPEPPIPLPPPTLPHRMVVKLFSPKALFVPSSK
jgi:hypothetical protein